MISRVTTVLKIPRFQQKIIKHAKKQENMPHSKKKETLTGTLPIEAQTLGLLVKDIKSRVLTMDTIWTTN